MAAILIEEKIVILPLELGRDMANKINGQTFDNVAALEEKIREEYVYEFNDLIEVLTAQRDVEELIDELGIYSIDEFVCQLNDEIYPKDLWVARVFIKN